MEPVSIEPVGEAALLVSCASSLEVAVQQQVWGLADALRGWPGIAETVPGIGNLLVLFDPCDTDRDALRAHIDRVWRQAPERAANGRDHTVAVAYGGAHGVDLDDVARTLGMTPDEVVDRHLRGEYTVAAVGSHPGFPYLIGLDPALSIARRAQPRTHVPAGAIMIAGGMSGIAACHTASGWHILGMTEPDLFDAYRQPPARFAPGDTVRFVRREDAR